MDKSFFRIKKSIFWITVLAIAMGFIEAAIVIYLRELYYREGFMFPLKLMSSSIIITEISREIATIIMLLSISIIAGRNFLARLAFFLLSFGAWDIFYYLWLKVLINWPVSILDWDILFLIPVTWASPVLAPIIVSLTMILLAIIILFYQEKNHQLKLRTSEWAILVLGTFFIFITFISDYTKLITQAGLRASIIFEKILQHVPANYNWPLFILGEFLILSAIGLIIRRVEVEEKAKIKKKAQA